MDFDDFEKSITHRTRIFLFCNPHNPVGRVYTTKELERIAEICLRRNVIICSDEIHCDLVYPPHRHVPFASIGPEVEARTVTLMSPSKTFNIAGLGCGYAIIKNEELQLQYMKVCIMCGGEGTRLRPLTFERPKPCVPIVNKPSIQHLVYHLSNLGFNEIIFTLGYMGGAIENAVGDGSLFGINVKYVHEKEKLGTAGSVKNAQKYLEEQSFLIVGGDHVTDLNLLEFYREHQGNNAMATIGLISIDDPSDYGIAEIDVNNQIKLL
jgi:hypothetical protein